MSYNGEVSGLALAALSDQTNRYAAAARSRPLRRAVNPILWLCRGLRSGFRGTG